MEDERKSPAVLRERAEKCRLARGIADTVASEQLARFAEELETQARLLEENFRVSRTNQEITRQALAELRHTSAQAKEAARRARTGRSKPAGEGDPES